MNKKYEGSVLAGVVLAVAVPILLLLAVIVITTVIGWIAPGVFGDIMGSEDCVVSWDYSEIEYMGETYVPLDTEEYGYILTPGAVLVEEARVEWAPVIGKLFFADSVYSVEEFDGAEVIWLMTDHDGMDTWYYVKQSEYDSVMAKLSGE